jgi:hypothetical protein
MRKPHYRLGKRLKAVVGVAAVVVVAAMMVGPPSASAKTDFLKGACAVPGRFNHTGQVLGSVNFVSRDGVAFVEVYDLCTDGWSIEAELFWGGEKRRPRRTCWAIRSGQHACDFRIPVNTRVWVYIAQAKRSTCDDPKSNPSLGCDKKHWKLAFVATA